MKRKKIKTMLELENILNDYLASNKPLVLLEEEYELTSKQRGFYINRVLAYSIGYDKINEKLGNIEDVKPGEEYLFMSHFIEEKYPFEHEQQIACFKRLSELKEKLKYTSDEEIIFDNDEKICELREKINNFNSGDIELARKINLEINEYEEENVDDLDDKLEESLRLKYKISLDEYERLNDLYEAYTYLINQINRRKNEIRLNNSKDYYERLQNEYENIRTELVHRNIKLANWVVRKFFKYIPFEMEDAQGYALEGLVDAINRFDYSKGYHFSSYATIVIKHTITRHFKEITGMTWTNFLNCYKYESYVEQYKEIDPDKKYVTAEDIYFSGISGMSYGALKNIESILVTNVLPETYAYPVDPLDERPYKSDFLQSFEDYEKEDEYLDAKEIYALTSENILNNDDPAFSTENIAILSTLREALLDAMSTLTDQEKQVLIMRFGINGDLPMTLDQVGAKFFRSKERIRQIEAKALRKLRHPTRKKKLQEFIDSDIYTSNKMKRKSIEEILIMMFQYEKEFSKNPTSLIDYDFTRIFNLGYYDNVKDIKNTYINVCEFINEHSYYINNKFTLKDNVNRLFKLNLPIKFFVDYIHYQESKNQRNSYYF